MGKRRTISAIDVGTTKVCTLIAEVGDNGQMRIAGVGTVPSKGMHKGMVVNINEAKETVRDSVKRAEQSSGYKVDSAYNWRHRTSCQWAEQQGRRCCDA